MEYPTPNFHAMEFKKSLFTTSLILLMIPYAVIAQHSETSDKQQFITIKENMQSAVDSMDKKKLIQAKYAMEDFTGSDDKQMQKLAHYYIGYADYRLHTQFEEVSDDEREQYLNEAQEHLEMTVDMDTFFAEGHAMLGSVYGLKAAGFFSGMKYGPKSSNAIEKGLEIAPGNPRVHMINAIGLLKKPSMFGGSTKGAIEEFKKAADLFKTFQPANDLMPGWGHAENYAWLGQAYEQNDQLEKAMAAYEQALEVNPNYQWVKYILMPELTEKMK